MEQLVASVLADGVSAGLRSGFPPEAQAELFVDNVTSQEAAQQLLVAHHQAGGCAEPVPAVPLRVPDSKKTLTVGTLALMEMIEPGHCISRRSSSKSGNSKRISLNAVLTSQQF